SSPSPGAKLVLIGSTIETARRVGQSAWSSFLASFYLTAHFSEDDYPWDWLQYWLQRQPQWRSSREFETTTRTTTVGLGSQNDMIEDEYTEEVDPNDEDTPGKQKMSVVFVPTFDSTIGIYYKKHWLRVRRWKHQHGTEMLSISVVARNNAVLKQLVLEAKKLYEADAEHRVNIYFADAHSSWRWTDSRTKRPLSSIVLNKGVKEMLLDDAKDFLRSEKWYATRGIPFRRGYLLHGVPGSGKTSLIHAMAGALALDIYVVSLSANWINDASLTSLMGRVPARCIVLLEDLDAAFTRSANRDDDSTGVPGGASKGTSELDAENGSSRHLSSLGRTRRDFVPDYNTLSLSGLLNALDGVSAPEGRLLFATTNHLERLDPALTRPGRMDVWVEFKNASQWQAEGLYTNFFSEVEQAAAAKENGLKVQRVAGETTAGAAGGKDAEASKESFVPKNGSAPSSMAGVEAMVSAIEAKEEQEQVKDFMLTPPPLERPVKTLGPAKIAALAKQFAAAIPDEEHSVASLQGYLLRNKSRPEAAVAEAAAWVQSERDLRVRLKREREERDAKMAIEREKRRKDRELAAERERREQLRRDREEAARIRKEDEEFAAEEKKAAEEKEKAEKEAKEKAEKEKNGEKVEDTKPSEPATTTPATTEPAPASTTPTPETPATPAAEATTPAPTPAATTTATEATPATPAASTEAEPQPAAGTVTPAESDVEVDGQTPGAQSIVLVKPEPATEAAAATTTVSA
ncbi:P-loop containing nucleoside triphosphate hydrolase protein, partial [Clavulina sp. PMI_390]